MVFKFAMRSIFFSSLVLMGACGHKKDHHHDEGAAETPPVARSFDSFRLTSAESIQIENFCESLSGFFADYQKTYLPEAEFKEEPFSDKKKCGGGIDSGDGKVFFQLNFALTKDDSEIHLAAPVTIYFDESSGLFSIKSNGLEKINGTTFDSLNWAVGNDKALLSSIGDGLKDLNPTYIKWVNLDRKELSIFGRPYSEFLTAITTGFSTNENKSSAIAPTLKFKLEPNAKDKGKVSFVAIAPEYFKKSEGSEDSTFLSCKDIVCLNASGIEYSISLNIITFRTSTLKSLESNVTASTTQQFSIAISGFPEN